MKKILSIAFMSAIVLLATPVFAEQKPPVDKAEQAKPSEPNVSEFDKQMAKAQENLKKMQVQMDRFSKHKTHKNGKSCCKYIGTQCRK